MQQPSRQVISNQQVIHADLDRIVLKHMESTFQKPISEISRKAFAAANRLYQQHKGEIILDSGCGVGESTYHIAKKFPEALVFGVDQSEHRINCNHDWVLPDNASLIRADLIDFWRLAVASNWQLAQHYLLYPNPWPKKKHLQRRWHGHPVFSVLKDLGGKIELRTNWQLYAEEFAQALMLLTGKKCPLEQLQPEQAISPFERKYQLSGQTLYRLRLDV